MQLLWTWVWRILKKQKPTNECPVWSSCALLSICPEDLTFPSTDACSAMLTDNSFTIAINRNNPNALQQKKETTDCKMQQKNPTRKHLQQDSLKRLQLLQAWGQRYWTCRRPGEESKCWWKVSSARDLEKNVCHTEDSEPDQWESQQHAQESQEENRDLGEMLC